MTDYDLRTQSVRKRLTARSSLLLVFLAISVIAGYAVGKDMALRDNAREAAAAAAAAP